MRQQSLSKQELIRLGVTDVKEDGTVYVEGKLKRMHVLTCKHPYGRDKHYIGVALLDKSQKIYPKNARKGWWAYKTRTISLGRLMLAWFYGEIPADMDADHIDGNPFNNNINNLQMLSRKDNLAKRFKDNPDNHVNQYK